MPAHKKHLRRFYDIDKQTECWIWKQYISPKGYGQLTYKQKVYRAHRFFWLQYNGSLPNWNKREVLDHLCKNKLCVNPSHLESTTVSINTRRGKSAKLNSKDIDKIKLLKSNGKRQIDIAKIFNINQCHVSRIVNSLRWT